MARPEALRAEALRLEADKLLSQIIYLAGLHAPDVALAGAPQLTLAPPPPFTPDPTDPAPVWQIEISHDNGQRSLVGTFLTVEEANHWARHMQGYDPASYQVVRA